MSAYRMFVFSAVSLAASACTTSPRLYDAGAGDRLDGGESKSGGLDGGESKSGLDAGVPETGESFSETSAPGASTAQTSTDGANSQTIGSSVDARLPTESSTLDAAADAACGEANAECPESSETATTDTVTYASDAEASDPSNSTDSASQSPSSSAPPSCVAETPDQDRSVCASPSGTDTAGCGLAASPCRTVQHAVTRAVATFRDHVLLDDGEFEELETLQIPAGVTLQGGWSRVNSTWQRACPSERSSQTVIQSQARVAVRVSAAGSVHLDALTIRTKDVGDTGESLYGVWVDGAESQLTLDEVTVVAGDAGSGLNGLPGQTLSGPQTCDEPGTGANGADGTNGQSSSSVFTRAGYSPGDGTTGENGQEGKTGTTGQSGSVLCIPYDGNCNHAPAPDYTLTAAGGKGGCGGGPGTGGTGGQGGGSSIALYVSQGQVAVHGGSLVAGAGGNGGEGGLPGEGGSGKTGAIGQEVNCPTQCGQNSGANGSRGGTGGKGGNGGKGGSGAGGNSVALVYAEDALVERTDVTLTVGEAGRGLGDGPLGFSEPDHAFIP